MKKRNATALSEILYQDLNQAGNYTEDFQQFLFENVLDIPSGVIYGLAVTQNGASGVSVASGALIDYTFTYGELEGASGVTLDDVPTGAVTRYDIVHGKFLEVADSPGASYVLIDVESRTQTTDTVYRRKFGSVVVEVTQDTTSGALTTGQIPLAQLTVTSGGIQTVTDLRSFVKPRKLDISVVESEINDLIANHAVGGDLEGTVDNATVIGIKSLAISGDPSASGMLLRVNATEDALEWVDGSSLGGSGGSNQILQWTNSGETITASGTLAYTVPSSASGALTLLAGDGQVFYDTSTYSFDVGKTTLTFDSTGDVPVIGSKLEYLFSSTTASGDASSGYLNQANLSTDTPTALGIAATAGSGNNVSKSNHVHELHTTSPVASGATINTDVSLGDHFHVTVGSNFTLANPTNAIDGKRVIWEIKQGGVGSYTITLGGDFVVSSDIGTLTLTTTVSKTDMIGAVYSSRTSKWHIVAFAKGF